MNSYLSDCKQRNNNFEVEAISNAFIVSMAVVTHNDDWFTLKVSVRDTNEVAILLNEYFMLKERN